VNTSRWLTRLNVFINDQDLVLAPLIVDHLNRTVKWSIKKTSEISCNDSTMLFVSQRSRAALERYLFYCNRYMNHAQSAKFESKLYAQVKQKMEEMQQHNMSWIEVSSTVCTQSTTLLWGEMQQHNITWIEVSSIVCISGLVCKMQQNLHQPFLK